MSVKLRAPSQGLISSLSSCLKSTRSPMHCSRRHFSFRTATTAAAATLASTAPATHSAATRSAIPATRRIWLDRSCVNANAARGFSSSGARRAYKTVEEAKSKYRSGPFSWQAGMIFFVSGAGLVFYFRYEKDRMERLRIADSTKGMGRPKVGGRFELVDQHGNAFTSDDMQGKYSLVYFGFSHCPDICPEELDKMAQMIDLVRASPDVLPPLLPVFITCDPARDTPGVLREYLAEFHGSLIGLTGTWEQIKAVCKAYRVYFSTPEGVQAGEDYLVDHSIYFYLMDPEGDFVEAIGRQHSPEQAARIMLDHMGDWKGK